MSELKPCPFCGGEATIGVSITTVRARAMCTKCNVTMTKCFKKHRRIKEILEELITEEWNRRASDGNERVQAD